MNPDPDPEWLAALRPTLPTPTPAPLPPVALRDPFEERRQALATAFEEIGREAWDMLSITVPIFVAVYWAIRLNRRQP